MHQWCWTGLLRLLDYPMPQACEYAIATDFCDEL